MGRFSYTPAPGPEDRGRGAVGGRMGGTNGRGFLVFRFYVYNYLNKHARRGRIILILFITDGVPAHEVSLFT